MTEYTVFQFEDGAEGSAGTWALMMTLEARSSSSAIRRFLSEFAGDGTEGKFTAVPHRSWRPVTVKVETKTALRFS